MSYKIIWDQKDYGHGATTHWDIIEAESETQAVEKLREQNCGVEEIFTITAHSMGFNEDVMHARGINLIEA